MSYAKRNDGAGWRAVNGPEDCGPDETWQAEQPALVEPSVSPLDQIAALESATMIPRVTREFMIAAMELEGSRMTPPVTPEALYLANIGYRRLRDMDEQIATLRAEL